MSDEAQFEFDPAFQKKIAALFACDTTFALATKDLLEPQYFTEAAVGTMVAIIGEHVRVYKNAPGVKLLPQLIKDAIAANRVRGDQLDDLKDVVKGILRADLSSPGYVTDKVADFAKHQAIEQAMMASIPYLEKGRFDEIEKVMKKALSVGAVSDGEDYDYFEEIVNRTKEREDIKAGKIVRDGITTGHSAIDGFLYHYGWGRRELSCIMGAAKAGKCVTRDTLVLTEDGLVEIGDYVPHDLKPDTFRKHTVNLLGRDGLEPTSHVYANGITPTVKIVTKMGFEIEGTCNHPMLTMSSAGAFEWVHLSRMREGSVLPLLRGRRVFGKHTDLSEAVRIAEQAHEECHRPTLTKMPILPETMTPELARFIAMIVAEAYLGDKHQIMFTQKCPAIMAEYLRLMRDLFGLECYVQKRSGSSCASVSSLVLRAYLEALGVEWGRSAAKTVPLAIRQAPEPCVTAFLNALLGLEGSVSRRSAGKTVFDLTMASERLVREVQTLLLNYGIVSRRRHKPGMATNGAQVVRDYWHLSVTGTRNLLRLREIGLLEDRKQAKLDALPSTDTTAQDWIRNARPLVKLALGEYQATGHSLKGTLDPTMWKMMRAIAGGQMPGKRELTYAFAEKIVTALDAVGASGPGSDGLRELLRLDYAYDEVVEISSGYTETVDFTVPGTHSFFANGLISHNSLSLGEFTKNAAMAGYNVLYDSLEVSKKIIAGRIDAAVSDTLMRELHKDPQKVEQAVRALQAKSGKFLMRDHPSGTLKPSQLYRLIEKYRAEGIVLDLVTVDYADIMAAEYRSDNQIENLRSIYIDLRAIAHEFNCAVLTATQTNRDGAKSASPKATDIGDDWNKARTVDILLGISATEAEKQAGEARIAWLLSRNTEDGFQLKIRQDRSRMQFLKSVVGKV